MAEDGGGGGGNDGVGGGPQVLLVEDEPNDVALLRRAFRLASLPPPRVVGDGEQAVLVLSGGGDGQGAGAAFAADGLPAFVLLDLKMPRMDGFELLRWLRAPERPAALRRLPVVVLTSSSQGPDVARAYDLGANSYLTKPVQFQALRELVEATRAYWAGLNVSPPPDARRDPA